jgi:ABC-type molybdate transport system ATPase subunit
MPPSRIKRLFSHVVVSDRRLRKVAQIAWQAQVAFEAAHPVAHDESISLRAVVGRMRRRVGYVVPDARLFDTAELEWPE